MRIPTQAGFLSATVMLALLAGCSGGGSQPLTPAAAIQAPTSGGLTGDAMAHSFVGLSHSVLAPGVREVSNPLRGGGFVGPDAATAVMAVSDAGANTVNLYSATHKLVATLTGFSQPQGLASDKAANLYVANTTASNILVYAKGYKGTPKTISDPNQYPAGVAVDGAGNIGVTNIVSTAGGAGSVTFFSKAGKIGKTIKNAAFARVYFDGFDDAGNLYIDGSNSSGATVVGEILKGANGTKISVLKTKNTIAFPGGIQVTTTDGISIGDQTGLAIDTYGVPKAGSLGTPKTTSLSGASDPVTFAYNVTNKDVWTADAGLASANEYKFPAGGSSIASITGFTQPIGVTLLPSQQP